MECSGTEPERPASSEPSRDISPLPKAKGMAQVAELGANKLAKAKRHDSRRTAQIGRIGYALTRLGHLHLR